MLGFCWVLVWRGLGSWLGLMLVMNAFSEIVSEWLGDWWLHMDWLD